jgi:chemotaxis protein histidine kinase CheA
MARVPEVLMARFRAAAMLRLERIDKAWAALVRGEASADTDAEMLRDVHTLKGDAKVVGLVDASLLVQRLEDLLGAARERHYSVHDDVDIVVTLANLFLGLLVRT